MRTQVRKIGNSLGSIIPSAFIRQLSLEEGAEIDVREKDGTIVIEPIKTKEKLFPFSEAELVAQMTNHNAHIDELAEITPEELGD
ncbi:AbrB/MazE/SpoVT family DNA-binding domain-containing protein [Vibrio sp. 10N.261.46.A3]|uniref:AbrB/MazE/SpoVT family DNA-binding domain-containing protein n=1 Tax=Vibrio sp. 10N.261.46.A3 TaxID=3229658 RepID=UPI003553CA8F